MRTFTLPLFVCLAAVVAETVLAGRDPRRVQRSLKQPPWALPPFAWYIIGAGYYLVCFLLLYRLSVRPSPLQSPAFWLLLVLMALNAGWNWLFFRRGSLRASFLFFVPYCAVAATLAIALLRFDRVAALVFAAYMSYLPYAIAWTFRVWKLNPSQ